MEPRAYRSAPAGHRLFFHFQNFQVPRVALPSGRPALSPGHLHFLKDPLWQVGPRLLQMTLNNTALCTALWQPQEESPAFCESGAF